MTKPLTVGIDGSERMLAKSTAFARAGLRFERGDIADFTTPRWYDLIFSNAALHWVPDHEPLLARLTAALAAGGQLAVQVPANHDHPAHRTATELAAEAPFAGALAAAARGDRGGRGDSGPHNAVLRPEVYAALLDRLGFVEQHVRLQVYAHHLESRDAVVEWVRGTTLTSYEQRLSPELFGRFLERYRERLLPRLADDRPFFYPFQRILLWARRPVG